MTKAQDGKRRIHTHRVRDVRSRYQPSKAELEADVSLPVTPERLVKAVVAGGAPRRK